MHSTSLALLLCAVLSLQQVAAAPMMTRRGGCLSCIKPSHPSTSQSINMLVTGNPSVAAQAARNQGGSSSQPRPRPPAPVKGTTAIAAHLAGGSGSGRKREVDAGPVMARSQIMRRGGCLSCIKPSHPSTSQSINMMVTQNPSVAAQAVRNQGGGSSQSRPSGHRGRG